MTNVEPAQKKRRSLIFDLLLVYALLAGAYFRFTGIDWGEYQYLHPDERFLVWVGSDITPLVCKDATLTVEACPQESRRWMSFSEYFDTAISTLNPVNRGHGFYVYGTLPMFMTRFAVEWIYGHSGFNEMTDVGRPLSALADLLTVLLVYLIAGASLRPACGCAGGSLFGGGGAANPALALLHHGYVRKLFHLPGDLFRGAPGR